MKKIYNEILHELGVCSNQVWAWIIINFPDKETVKNPNTRNWNHMSYDCAGLLVGCVPVISGFRSKENAEICCWHFSRKTPKFPCYFAFKKYEEEKRARWICKRVAQRTKLLLAYNLRITAKGYDENPHAETCKLFLAKIIINGWPFLISFGVVAIVPKGCSLERFSKSFTNRTQYCDKV